MHSQAHGWRGRALNRRAGPQPAFAARGPGARQAFGALGALAASLLVALLGAGLALRLLADRRA